MLALVLLGLLTTPDEVLLHSAPDPNAPIVGRYVPVDALRVFDYDKLGAAVYQIKGTWYLVSTGTEKAWLQKTASMAFHSYRDLLKRRVPLLAGRWDGKLYVEPGRNAVDSPQLKDAIKTRGSVGVTILTRCLYEGQLWFQIQAPVADACGEVPPNVSPATGWIPAYDAEGEPYIWFSPMGC